MPITSIYSVIGDSNIRRNMTSMNIASRQVMSDCQLIDCPPLSGLEEAFTSVRAESTVCVFQAMTQLLLHAADVGTFQSTIEALLHEVSTKIAVWCHARPALTVMVAPPMYRAWPLWYRHHLPEVSAFFSTAFGKLKSPNLVLLPSFFNQDVMPDGVHLTPVAGLHYLLHIFDESEKAIRDRALSHEDRFPQVSESTRANNDRIVMLEHEHSRLVGQVNDKIATDAEFDDWMTNRADEDWLTISGLPRLSTVGKAWQNDVRKQVRAALLEVAKTFRLHLRFEVLYVYNPIKQRTSGPTLYHVRLDSVECSKSLRDAWSGFFNKSRPVSKPPALSAVTRIANKVTQATRVRIAILRELGTNYHQRNPGSSIKVRGYESRPSILVVPPSSAKDPRVKNFFFMEAVRTLPAQFSDENLVAIFKVIGAKFLGQLRDLFVVLCDDDRDRVVQLVKDDRDRQGRHGRGGGAASSFSGAVTGLGSGMDLEANFLGSLRRPPPPPPTSSPVSEAPQDIAVKKSRGRSPDRGPKSSRAVSPARSPSSHREAATKFRKKSPVRSPRASRAGSPARSPSPHREAAKKSRKKSPVRSPSTSRKRKRQSKKKSKGRKSRRRSSSRSSSSSSSDSESSSESDSSRRRGRK